MKQSPSWEANYRSFGQENLSFMKYEVRLRFQKSPSLRHVRSQRKEAYNLIINVDVGSILLFYLFWISQMVHSLHIFLA